MHLRKLTREVLYSVLVVVSISSIGSAAMNFGITGAVKNKQKKLADKIDQQKSVPSSKPLSGLISTVVGKGGFGYNGDGIAATAAYMGPPVGIAFDSAGNMYMAEVYIARVRRVDVITGLIDTFAGTGGTAGYNGDGIAATSAEIYPAFGIAVDVSNNIYFCEQWDGRIRKVDVNTKLISTVAGGGGLGSYGDGVLATSASLRKPQGIAVDSHGNLFIADTETHRIRKVDASTGIIGTIAGLGLGMEGYNGDGIAATSARLTRPQDVVVDSVGNIFICDSGNSRIRKIDAATGLISTIAGTDTRGYNGDGIRADSAKLYSPHGIALDRFGNLFIADRWNNRIRKVDAIT